MISALVFTALFHGAQASPPRFTDIHMQQAEACADGPAPSQCANADAQAAARRCMQGLPAHSDDSAFGACMAAVTDHCISNWSSTTSEMNRRVILICAARTRAATRVEIDAWLNRADQRLDPSISRQYRAQLATVDTRLKEQTEEIRTDGAGNVEVRIAGTRNGIWESFARFLWLSERKAR